MTTHSYSSPIDHTGDAGFRAWGSALSAGLLAAGLVQTADTGQIDWGTVTRPGTNTAAGYEIWRLANSSLYFKFEFGTGSSSTIPAMWITVGEGSNGSGTLTGQLSDRRTWTFAGGATSTAASLTTYISVITDGLFVVWGQNGFSTNSSPGGSLAIHASVDADGVTSSTGYSVLSQNGGSGWVMQSVKLSGTPFTGNVSQFFSLVPGAPTTSADANGDNRVWLCWSEFQRAMEPFIGACTYVLADWADTTTKSITLFGSTAHTYLAIGLVGSSGAANGTSNVYGLAIIYE